MSLIGTSQKSSYIKNGIPCWILAYSRERPCRACPTWNIFWIDMKLLKKITTNCNIKMTFGITEFGSVMKKLWHFYPKHLFFTSFRTSHKPYFPRSVTPKIQWPTRWIFYQKYLDMFPQWNSNFTVWIILKKQLLRKWWDDL